MKKMLVLIFLFGTISELMAQGIKFQETYKGAHAEAVKQKKILFIDFYTAWCGPCKLLKKDVFTQTKVGDYFNHNFISIALDAEKEGRELAKKYNITAYPTLLFLNVEDDVVVNKLIGAIDAEALIKAGENAVALKDDPNNITNLHKQYPSKKSDPDFLELYIKKIKKSGELSYNVIDDYLKVQNKMRERGSKMMEYLINNRHYLLLGGQAERIFNENEDFYLKMSTKEEEKSLINMRLNILLQTRGYALEENNVPMYEIFLDRWEKLKEKPYFQNHTGLELELLTLKNDKKAYKKQALIYLDSIVNSRSIEDVIAMDHKRYEEYCKENTGGGMYAESMRESYKGLDAKLQIVAIVEVGSQLLKNAKKSDYKYFNKWIEHGKKLVPDGYVIPNFEANMLYRQGKINEAIEAKKIAYSKIPSGYRFRQDIKKELAEMENGTFNQGIIMER